MGRPLFRRIAKGQECYISGKVAGNSRTDHASNLYDLINVRVANYLPGLLSTL